MAALPPFPQMIADMGGLGSLGSRRGCLCVHGENLAREFRAFHYLRRNRIAHRRGPSCEALQSSPRRRLAMIHPSLFLRRAFLLDAIVSGTLAVLLTLAPARSRRCSSCPKRCCARPACSWSPIPRWSAGSARGRRCRSTGGDRDRRECGVDARQHRAVVLQRGNAEPAWSGLCRGTGDACPAPLAELQYIGLRRSKDALAA